MDVKICKCEVCGEVKECNPQTLKDLKGVERIEYWCKECEDDLFWQYCEDNGKYYYEELKRSMM